jgi:hypothetical protein
VAAAKDVMALEVLPLQELQILVAAVALGRWSQLLRFLALAALALSSCPTPCQKAQYLLLRLQAHLKAQLHPQLLTT